MPKLVVSAATKYGDNSLPFQALSNNYRRQENEKLKTDSCIASTHDHAMGIPNTNVLLASGPQTFPSQVCHLNKKNIPNKANKYIDFTANENFIYWKI